MGKKWQMLTYQSGSMLVTNGEIAFYLHTIDILTVNELSEAERDAMRFKYAKWLEEILNSLPEQMEMNK